MVTGAEIVEPAVSSMEHSIAKLDQAVNEFSPEELKSHVELQQPLEAMENLEKLGNVNGCNIEECTLVVHEGNGGTSEGESFTESPPSAKVVIEQSEAGEVQHEAPNEMLIHEKQPLGYVTGGEEQIREQNDKTSRINDAVEAACLAITKEEEPEVHNEQDLSQGTSREECAPIIKKEVSILEESVKEIEPERSYLEHAKSNPGETNEANDGASSTHKLDGTQNLTDLNNEMKDAEAVKDDAECKRQLSGFSLSMEMEVQIPMEPVNESKVPDSSSIEKSEEESTEQSAMGKKKPEDCIHVAARELPDAGVAVPTEEGTPNTRELYSFQQEEGIEDKDKPTLSHIREEEMNTSQPAEMETGKPDEVSSSKPEEQVTEKYESPMLMERRTEDVYDGESKRTEITVGTHLSAEKLNISVVEEAGQRRCEAGDTKIEKLNEVSDLDPKDQVNEDGEAPADIKTKADNEPKASKDAENAIGRDPSENNMPLTEGEKSGEIVEKQGYEQEEKQVIEQEATMQKETQAEDESKASESKDNILTGQKSMKQNLLPNEEADLPYNGANDTGAEKLDEIPSIQCKVQVNVENKAMIFEEAQTEDIVKANECTETATTVDSSTKKENPPLIPEAGQSNSGVDNGETEKMNAVSSFKSEDLTHEEHEGHGVKETLAEDKTEASESKEITNAGHSSPEQNLLQNQAEEEFKNASVDAEVEKPNEISNFEPDEQGNREQGAPKAQAIQAEEESKTRKDSECVIAEHSPTEKECEMNRTAVGEEDNTKEMIKETNAAEAIGVLEKGTDGENSSKEVHEEQIGAKVSKEHYAEASSANPEGHHLTEEVANPDFAPSGDKKEVELSELKNDTGNAFDIREEAAKATVTLAEENDVARSTEDAERKSFRNTPEEANLPTPIVVSRHPEEEISPELPAPVMVETNQGRMDESRVPDENNSTQYVQIDENENTEPIPASSENEKTILEVSIASTNPDDEDHELENITADSKADASAIEEVTDPSDVGKEKSCVSEPASEDHGYEAPLGTKEDTFQNPDDSPIEDDVNKITASEISGREIKERMELMSETRKLEIVNETTDVVEVAKEQDDTERAPKDEKEVEVQYEVKTEASLGAEVKQEKCVEEEELRTSGAPKYVVGEEKCVEEEDEQTNGAPKPEIAASESLHYTSQVVDEVDARSHKEVVKAEMQEKDGETTEKVISETEVPELSTEFEGANKQNTSEEVTTGSEREKQCKEIARASDSTEKKVSSEEAHDAEILTRNATVDITDQCKTNKQNVSEENPSDKNIQMDHSECEKACDESLNNTESLPAGSETEKIILEESTASKRTEKELEENNRLENAQDDSKRSSHTKEEVADSADTEISCVSEPASGDQSCEACSGTKQEKLQIPDVSPVLGDVKESAGQDCLPSEMTDNEIKEKVQPKSETDLYETVGETTDATKLTKKDYDTEKAYENDMEVKAQHDVNLESSLATGKSAEKCLEEEDVQIDGAPKTEVEVNDNIEDPPHVEDEVNICLQETIKPEIQEKDGETTQEVISETEVQELSTTLEDVHMQTTSNEVTASSEPEQQCEKTTGANDSVEERVSSEEVDDGEEKARVSESMEEKVVDEVTVSKEIHAPVPVEHTTVEETDAVPGLGCTEAKVEKVHAMEINAGSGKCESMKDDFEKEKMQEEATVSIPQTEDAREESSSNLMSEQSIPEQHNAVKEEAAAVQDRDDEHVKSKGAHEEACHPICPETEVMDAVEATFEVEKSEVSGNTREIKEVSREMDVSDSQLAESVAGEETNSDQSREMETQVLPPVPAAIPENNENEIAEMVEKTGEENNTGAEMQENETLELSNASELTKVKEEATANGDTEANEGRLDFPNETDKEAVTKGEDSKQEPLKEESEMACVDSSVGKESTVTGSPADISLERTEMPREARPGIQVEQKPSGLEGSESMNLNVEEVTIEAEKRHENILEAKDISQYVTLNDEKHCGDGDVLVRDSTEQSTKKDVPEGRDYATVSAENDQEAAKDEQTKEEEEDVSQMNEEKQEVSTSTNELSTEEEVQEVKRFDSIEQIRAVAGVIEEESIKEVGVQENENLELSSAAEVTKEECSETGKQTEDVVSEVTEVAEDAPNKSTLVEALQVDLPEKQRKMKHAESPVTPEKTSELTVETETISDLTSQRIEMKEQVKAETLIEEKPLASNGSETRNLISKEETSEAGNEYKDADGAHGIVQDDISNKKDDDGRGKAHEVECSDDAKAPCEISPANYATSEEKGSSTVLQEYGIVNEAAPTNKSAPSHKVADGNIDDGQKIVSIALADDLEEHLAEKVSEKAETPCEESNAASLSIEATKINLGKAELDEPVKELVCEIPKTSLDVEERIAGTDAITSNIDTKIHPDDALEVNDIKRDEILDEEENDTHEKAYASTSIKEELNAKDCTIEEIQAEYKERDSALAEDIAAKDHNEQTQAGNREPESYAKSKSESPIMGALETDKTRAEQVSTSTEEMKEVKGVEKEDSEEADAGGKKIGPVAPKITDPPSITDEVEETMKERELQHNENLQSSSATGAMEAVRLEEANERNTKAAESVSDIKIHEVSNQLEGLEIKEKHFEVTPVDSVAEEKSGKIVEVDLPDIASRGQKQEYGKPYPMAEGTTEEIHEEDKLKDEEVMEEKTETLKSTVDELQYQEVAKEHAINEDTAQNESDAVLVETQEIKKSSVQEGEGINDHAEDKKVMEVEVAPSHKEFNEISQEIKQEEKFSIASTKGEDPSENSPCKTMDTVNPIGKDDASVKVEETATRTFKKPEESILGTENPPPEHGGERALYAQREKACEEPTLIDEAPASLSDLLKESTAEKLQVLIDVTETKAAIDSSLLTQAEEAEMAKAAETKTDEECDGDGADEDEHKRLTPQQDAPVMQEPFKDNDIKAHHKKSHNILSGVGSKVKHSISKVKKAITGKSSHSKTQSPKQSS